ncbi:MAG: PEP-CTERM sorting domain-containing protein [Acidobacteriia bacterium]|nr:PEP-CTERM sorting domain-containing protein [Terriglobia bacterium]
MNRTLICCAVVLAVCAALNAAPVACLGSPFSLTPGGASPTIACGGITFTNFSLLNLSGQNAGHLDITNVTFDSATGLVTLSENPNLGSGGHENLIYTVSGPLVSAGMSVGGTSATVIERACANPIPTTGVLANLCTDSSQTTSATPLTELIVHSGDANQPVTGSFAQATTAYVYKDIGASSGGSLNSLQESFGSMSSVPEPSSLLLLSAAMLGLVGMAAVRPRRS